LPRRTDGQPEEQTKGRARRRLSREERLPADIAAILKHLEDFLNGTDEEGRKVCDCTWGIYAFFDYDDEPIYVGQTYESLRTRIRRHLTNQRTDAVAMHVLDPMEVAYIAVWPLWDLAGLTPEERMDLLNRAEYTAYEELTRQARVSKLLNEKAPAPTDLIDLPKMYKGVIVPDDIRQRLAHADERIARRASTIANLAQVAKERDVSLGLRETLVTQAQRLELLARRRLEEVRGETPSQELLSETRRSGAENADAESDD